MRRGAAAGVVLLALLAAVGPPAACAEIAFVRAGSVWVSGDDGGGQRRLAPGSHPSIDPTGRRVAFIRDRHDIRRVPVSGGRSELVARLPDTRNPDHRFSPDGRLLAWAGNGGVFVGPAGGGVPRRVAGPAPLGISGLGSWSPDSRELAFMQPYLEYVTAYVAFVYGHGSRRLGTGIVGPWGAPGPALAVGGCNHYGDCSPYSVYLGRLGSDQIALPTTVAAPLAWLPDGRLLATDRAGALVAVDPGTGSVAALPVSGPFTALSRDGTTILQETPDHHVVLQPLDGSPGRTVLADATQVAWTG